MGNANHDRRFVIETITAHWISKNKERLTDLVTSVKAMRQARPGENQMHRYKATIPGDLIRQLDFALESDGDVRAFTPDGELEWFSTKYPEFTIPYDHTESVREVR